MGRIATMLLALVTSGFLVGCSAEQSSTADVEEAATLSDAEAQADERAELAAGSDLPQPTVATELLDCQPARGMTPYCGFQNPEDLVHIPDTSLLIVSEMGEFMADSPGALSLFDLESERRAELTIDWASSAESWGDPTCPSPDAEALSPHGIDLVRRDDGALALLVVNHGKRESVEFFEVAQSGDLSWRGCALPPGDPFINDVAARSDGGFYVTHMWDKSVDFVATVARLQAGEATGWVWAWTPGDGFNRVPGSDALMPNGIAIDAANETLYVNVYFGGRTFAIDLLSGEKIADIEVRQPDNVTVDSDGSVWIASHQHDPIGQACTLVTEGPCLLPFQVVKAAARTLEPEIVVDHDGPPMGYATVALNTNGSLYLGTAHGDRIVNIDLDAD